MIVPGTRRDRTLWIVDFAASGYAEETRKRVEYPHQANIIGSELTDGLHSPVLDIDYAAHLEPSSTPGHFHLYLDGLVLPWERYADLLEVMGGVGMIQPGYAGASIERQGSFVRPPWVRK